MTKELKYSIDRVVIRDNRIFGFGWVFHPDMPVESVRLELLTAGDNIISLPVIYGKPRQDVSARYPGSRYSLCCGYVVHGGWSANSKVVKTRLAVEIAGEVFHLALPATVLSGGAGLALARYPYRLMMERTWSLLRQGKMKLLLQKARHFGAGKPGGQGDISAVVRRHLEENTCSRFMLVLDHNLGGGANKYRERLISERIEGGCGTLLLSFHLLSLQYTLEICTSGCRQRFSISGLDILVRLAEEGLISEAFYNNAVSFEHPEDVPDLLLTMRSAYGIPYTIAMHDYFPVCPSYYLLDAGKKHCGVPDLDTCQDCLPVIDSGFASFFESRDIRLWRSKWGACLDMADNVLCFCIASRDLLLRAYPDLRTDQIDVIPHSTSYFPSRKPRLNMSAGLHVGILGEIGPQKGSAVVQALSEEIIRQKAATRISVIGTLEAECDATVVSETGPYDYSSLVDLVEDSDANVFLFPSIWPETFSYVVDELMQLEVPVVCFDMGAPAERVGRYSRGKVIPLSDARELLSQLDSFYAELTRPKAIGE